MALEVTGTLKQIFDEVRGQGRNNNEWVKRDFLIELDGQSQYPKSICFTAWGDKAQEITQYSPGQSLKVSFDLSSREYNGRWYTDIRAWRLDAVGGSVARGGDGIDPVYPDAPITPSGAEDDLPF